MKNMGTKKAVFIGSTIATIVVYTWEYIGNVELCTIGGFNSNCWDILHDAQLIIIPISTLLFFLSLVTLKMHDEVFHAWWSFARWMVPIIVFSTVLIQFVPKNGGFFNMDGLIYLLVSAPLYAVFILGSLWKIFRAYRGI